MNIEGKVAIARRVSEPEDIAAAILSLITGSDAERSRRAQAVRSSK